MKKQKSKLILVLMGLFIISSYCLNAQIAKEEFTYNALLKKASQKGYVRVIVEMKVPDIESLTAVSTSFKTGDMHRAARQYALDADMELDRAITNTRDEILVALNGTNYHINRTYATIPAVALTCSRAALEQMALSPCVVRITEDFAEKLPPMPPLDTTTEDPDEAQLTQSTHIIGADVAWNYGYAGQGWYIAILDSGILRSHDMFRGKNIVEQCYASGENMGENGIGDCPNGRTEMSGTGAAAPYQPRFYHGTHVAGIAAGNDGSTHFGVARDANIMAVQVFSYFSDEDDQLSWNSDQLKALEYVYLMRNTYNIAAINMSLGGGMYSNYCANSNRAQIITNLRAAGIATIAASGNEAYCNAIIDPACTPSSIAINGTTKQDLEYASGNQSNTLVSLMAPGESINSALSTSTSTYGSLSGTSMATPHVAGAWAVLKSYNANLTVDNILTTLKETGVMIPSSRCPGNIAKPRINVGDALMTLFRIAPPINIAGVQETNRAFLQYEYINVLTWADNPRNNGKNVVAYRIYKVNGAQETLLAEVPVSTHVYWDRAAARRTNVTYSISAVGGDGEESPRYLYTLGF